MSQIILSPKLYKFYQPSSDTTQWRDKHLGETPRVINITYRDAINPKGLSPMCMNSIICYINYSFFSSLFNVWLYSYVYIQQVTASRENILKWSLLAIF